MAIATPEAEVKGPTVTAAQPKLTVISANTYTWISISDGSQAASLCPECGGELQVMSD
jgi:hypothetical protein